MEDAGGLGGAQGHDCPAFGRARRLYAEGLRGPMPAGGVRQRGCHGLLSAGELVPSRAQLPPPRHERLNSALAGAPLHLLGVDRPDMAHCLALGAVVAGAHCLGCHGGRGQGHVALRLPLKPPRPEPNARLLPAGQVGQGLAEPPARRLARVEGVKAPPGGHVLGARRDIPFWGSWMGPAGPAPDGPRPFLEGRIQGPGALSAGAGEAARAGR
mmetsp:Transcript_105774/g.341217  ORF Transcript_105774/g.341217 Transcript_105774/m.341217 type:complete len:213 (+) Transcript_105774:332-970(+)